MRIAKFALSSLVLSALSVSALAQSDNSFGLRFRVGWAETGTFTNWFNSEVNIVGPEFGVDVPIMATRGLEYYLSGSVIAGGRLSHGGDTDGEIFKLLLSVKSNLDHRGTYVMLGAGLSTVNPRSPTFTGTSGFVGRVAVGAPIGRFFGNGENSVEIATTLSREGQLKGIFYGVTGKF